MHLWFKAVLIPIYVLILYYITWRFFVIFHNNNTPSFILLLAITIILTLTLTYKWKNKTINQMWTITGWFSGTVIIIMIILLIEHLISNWYKINPRIIVWILIIIISLWIYYSLHTTITELNINSKKISKNIKILLVSDIHTNNVLSTYYFDKIKNIINKEIPDFVIFAWDLIDEGNEQYANYFSFFKSIKKIPIFAVIWNHDIIWDTEAIKNIPKISWINLLNNESFNFYYGKNNNEYIQIIWVVDKKIRWKNSIEDILDKIKLENNKNVFTILITHKPIKLEKLKNYPIDLEVAWHTHHGQIYGIRKIVGWIYDYTYWEHKCGDRTAFVSQWIWTWRFLNLRLWTQSEMVIINLIRK